MTLSRQTLKRLPYIKQGIFSGLNRDQIADICKCSHKTIDRDMRGWIESNLFETWIKEEFVETYPDIKKEDKGLAFQEIAKLVGKMLTRKIERKEQIELSQKVEVNVTSNLQQYESLIAEELNRTLHANSATKQVDPAQATPETSPVPTA